jgi:tetratricopeptide (TPR) repeat protein
MSFPFLSSEEFDEQAHQHYNAGEYDQALEVLREGLERFPESVDLQVGLGYVRLAREEFAWARRTFQDALAVDPEHEDAWVGLGEALLKFGQLEEGLKCFARVDELKLGADLELGLAIGRALYREGLYRESQTRLAALAALHRESAEVRAALGYTLHALGDDLGARRELRSALRLDPELHEVRIYLAHLLFERGDLANALREMAMVPAAEHWDTLSLWRYIELRCSIDGLTENDPSLAPWRERWSELQDEPDAVDHLLAEVEASFEASEGDVTAAVAPPVLDFHRVRTADGKVFTGSWEEIVRCMRDDLSDAEEPISTFMRRAAQRVRSLTGCDLPCDDAESFIRESAKIGLLRIED